MTLKIRIYSDADRADCHDVYVDSVRNGTAPFYTAEQAHAWAPSLTDDEEWTGRLGTGTTWVAETEDGISGFITLTSDGHLDFFFVRPAARSAGTAQALYATMIEQAQSDGFDRLTTHASHLARRFLEKRGWEVVAEEDVVRNGVVLRRSRMELNKLADPATES